METIDNNSIFCFIIPSFNNELNIEKNLTSLITQTNTNWRCIYIDDCSTDKTGSLFFDIVKKHNVNSKFTYLKNDKNYGQAYSKYRAYKLVDDFEIVCILDGDDWLSDNNVITRLTQVYSDKNVHIVSSSYQEWENKLMPKTNNFRTYPPNIIANKQYRKQSEWLIRHLKTGYGIFFKSIPKKYLTLNGEWLKVATDVAEYYSVLELSKGKYVALNDVMYIYNKSNSLQYTTSFFREESKDLYKTSLNYVLSLPLCRYELPRTYIINMAKSTKKRENMNIQLKYQSNKNFKFIEAIDGSSNPETSNFMKKYFEYMNIKNNSQLVSFDRSKMVSSLKNKYNFRRQHITMGALGLIQSAFLLMTEFVAGDTDHALIFEDDSYTIKNLDKHLFINDELLKNKDLVYLGCHNDKHDIYSKKSNSIFINILNYPDLIYGAYAVIISKRLAQHILDIGIDMILQLNISWDLILNYIRDTEKQKFTFFLYFKELFIPNVIKHGGVNPFRDVSFYTKNKISLSNYYIPGVTNQQTNHEIANVLSTHNESNFFDFITKAVYINLEDRVDRKRHAESQLLKYIDGSKIIRFNAIRHARGAIGCGLSHIAVLKQAIQEKWDNVFIAEDDITWTDQFKRGHRILENLIRMDYDVIVLGATFIKSYKDSFKLISCNCALAYIVNKSYYTKLLDCFTNAVDKLKISYEQTKYAIDQAWKPLQRRDNWFIIKPNMCIQLPSYSNIENVHKDYIKWFDRSIEYPREVNPEDTDLYQRPTFYNKFFNPGVVDIENDIYNDNDSTNWLNRYLSIRNITFTPKRVVNLKPILPNNNIIPKSLSIRNINFAIKESINVKSILPDNNLIPKSLNVPKLWFGVQADKQKAKQIEHITFYPPNIKNKYFSYKNNTTDIKLIRNDVEPIKQVKIRNINFKLRPSPPPSIPPPRIVSFKNLMKMIKTNGVY
jgi:GR25 family glycosyltransferase involved in LPS biosynthesis